MPVRIIAEKGKPMAKKKGFLNYGKDDEEEEPAAEGETEEGEGQDPGEMRLMHLAEKTGVEDPEALVKLIKACISQSG